MVVLFVLRIKFQKPETVVWLQQTISWTVQHLEVISLFKQLDYIGAHFVMWISGFGLRRYN